MAFVGVCWRIAAEAGRANCTSMMDGGEISLLVVPIGSANGGKKN